jgi:hypothetical protein
LILSPSVLNRTAVPRNWRICFLLEALLGAGFGLELGHLALLCGSSRGQTPGWPDFARWSVLIEHFAAATAALSAGRRKGGVMAEAGGKYNRAPAWGDVSRESGEPNGNGTAARSRPWNDEGLRAAVQ